MEEEKNLPLTLSITKAAKAIGWSRPRLYNHIKKGWIRVHRMGGRIHIITSELMQDLKK